MCRSAIIHNAIHKELKFMRVIIVGAGVIGVTTAYFLQQHGCEVQIIDRASAPGMACSYANGGFYSAGLAAPWSAPGAVRMAFAAQFDKSAAFKWRPDFTWRQIAWMMQSLKECRPHRFTINRARLTRLATYAQACLQRIESDLSIDYQRSADGILQVYREPVPRALIDTQLRYLETMGIAADFLPREQVFTLEPALAHSTPHLLGGLRIREDMSGDCHVFTRKLAEVIQAQGGTFTWNTTVESLRTDGSGTTGKRIRALVSQDTEFQADAYVVAAGADTPMLLKSLVDIPVYPIKGYSISAPIVANECAPRHSVFDFATKTGMARLGNEMRISGIAEITGYDRSVNATRCAQLVSAFERAFPGAIDGQCASHWAGLRPATPDGVPLVGRTACENLYVNTGHDGFGWSTSCGSGKLIADIVMGRPADIDAADYALARSH
ncbi:MULTISPECIES: D-amino acid dehydrogenase [Burkholderia]|uniref:D-amino acid dehydrogenase n=1 Tax=Burkholderia TaxID=32008 RepID=UPI0030B7FA0F